MVSPAFRCTITIYGVLLLTLVPKFLVGYETPPSAQKLAAQQKGEGGAIVSSGLPRVTRIQQQTTPDGIRIVIEIEKSVEYQVGQATNPNRVFLDLSGTRPASELDGIHIRGQNPALRQIRVAQYQPTTTRVVLDLNRTASYQATYLSGPPRLMIDLHPDQTDQSQLAPSNPKHDTAPKLASIQTAALEPSSLYPSKAPQKSDVPKMKQRGTNRSDQKTSIQVALGANPGLVMSGTPEAGPAAQPKLQDQGSPGQGPAVSVEHGTRSPVEADKARGQREIAIGPKSEVARSSTETKVDGAGSAGPEALSRLPFDAARDVPSDPTSAARWYLKFAEQGVAEAQFRLGSMYMTGRGVERKHVEAAKWYTRAAQQGHPLAQSDLGVLYANGWGVAGDDTEAVKWFRRAALQGDAGGENNLGAMYLTGRGVARDEVEAARWLGKAAAQGLAEAQYALGTLYANGRGVPHEDTEAVKLFQKAAEHVYAPAQLALGRMYAAGQGTAKDEKAAAAYVQRAAEQGLAQAQFQVGLFYQEGRGVARNDEEATRWFKQAAGQGSGDAQYHLGEIYRDGRGPAKNLVTAYSWFALAAATGHEQAMSALNSLAPRMTMNQIAEGQQLALATASHGLMKRSSGLTAQK